MRVFGCKCFILNNDKDNLGKFDAKADEGIFLDYASHSHVYSTYNKRIMLIEKTVHITFDESNQRLQEVPKLVVGDEELNEFQRLNIIVGQNSKEVGFAKPQEDDTVVEIPPKTARRSDLPQE